MKIGIRQWSLRDLKETALRGIISERAYMGYSLFFLVLIITVIAMEEAFDLFMLFRVHGTEFQRK